MRAFQECCKGVEPAEVVWQNETANASRAASSGVNRFVTCEYLEHLS